MVNKTTFETINIDDFIHDPINQEKVQSYPPELVGRFNSFIVTAFDDSMTVEMQIRTLIKWIKENIDVTMSALDNMEAFKQDSMAFQNHVKNTLVNLINQFTDKFDDNLKDETLAILTKWFDDGVLSDIVRNAINEEVINARGGKDTLGQRLDESDDLLMNVNNEVLNARGGKDNLGQRLDETDAKLAQIEKMNLISVDNPPSNLTPVIPNGTSDNREDLQTLIDYASANGFEGIYIPPTDQPYRIDVSHTGTNSHTENGLHIPSNFKLIMHPDTELHALTSDYPYHVMFNVHDAKNVLIKGGILKGERHSHTEPNEFGYGVYIHGSENIIIEDVISKDWWGDCFTTRDIDLVGGISQPCRNIELNNVVADNGCRQGLSIISGKGVRVLNSIFRNTNGTAPGGGIDLEPNHSDDTKKVENVLIDNCVMENNVGYGIVASNTIGLTVKNCTLNDNNIHLSSTVEQSSIDSNRLNGAGFEIASESTIVKDNVIQNYLNTNGVFFITKSNNSFLTVKGNNVYNCSRGINLAVPCKNISFENNYISGSITGLMFCQGTSSNISFVKNTFEKNAGYGYFNLNDSFIADNVFRDNFVNLQHNGGSNTVIQNNVFSVGNNTMSGINFIVIVSGVEGAILDGNKLLATSSDSVIPIAITANAERQVPIIVRNNISMKTTTIFNNPPGGTLMANNYSA